MALDIDEIGGEMLGVARGHVHRSPAGRVCAQPGCRTRLSVYNSRPKCALHDFDTSLANFRWPLVSLSHARKPAPSPLAHPTRAA